MIHDPRFWILVFAIASVIALFITLVWAVHTTHKDIEKLDKL